MPTSRKDRWLKREISEMRGAISSFYVTHRPMAPAYCADIVKAGIRQMRSLVLERARKDDEFVEHLRTHPEVYGSSTPEMVARFSAMAADERSAAAWPACRDSAVRPERDARRIARMAKPEHSGGFRDLDMTHLIALSPKKAAEQILAAYRVAGASLKDAAKLLDCTERTLHRWVDRLELRPEIDKLTARAMREGWMTPKRHPHTGKSSAG